MLGRRENRNPFKNMVEKAMILQATLRKFRAIVVKIVQDRMEGINNAEQRIEGEIDVEI